MQLEVKKHLYDVLAAAEDIREFTRDLQYIEYVGDVKTQAAVERKFEIIGEALNRIRRRDPALVAGIPDHVRIIGFRNVISHGYDVINPAIIWDVVQNHLAVLIHAVEELLKT